MQKNRILSPAGAVALAAAVVLASGCGGGGSGGGRSRSGSGASAGSGTGGGAPPARTPAPTVTVTVDPILAQGASGSGVMALQALLNAWRMRAGIPAIAQDGDFGPATLAAVERFQADRGLPVTGIVWQNTWDALREPLSSDRLGAIDPIGTPATPDLYIGPTSTPDVAIHVLPPVEVRPGRFASPLLYQSQMAIDADGAGPAWQSDPWGQPGTSLTWPNGEALDPLVTPYFVLPIGFEALHPEVKLSDIAAIVHRDRVTYALYGDRGPRGKIGEASILTAGRLGIPANPAHGGAPHGVTTIIFPGSGTGAPLHASEIDAVGRALFAKAGGRP